MCKNRGKMEVMCLKSPNAPQKITDPVAKNLLRAIDDLMYEMSLKRELVYYMDSVVPSMNPRKSAQGHLMALVRKARKINLFESRPTHKVFFFFSESLQRDSFVVLNGFCFV